MISNNSAIIFYAENLFPESHILITYLVVVEGFVPQVSVTKSSYPAVLMSCPESTIIHFAYTQVLFGFLLQSSSKQQQ